MKYEKNARNSEWRQRSPYRPSLPLFFGGNLSLRIPRTGGTIPSGTADIRL